MSIPVKLRPTILLVPDHQLPTLEEVYAFLKSRYRHSRFEGRNSDPWYGAEYSLRIAQNRLDDLQRTGWSVISIHEDQIGRGVLFDARLIDLSADEPAIERVFTRAHLTHLF